METITQTEWYVYVLLGGLVLTLIILIGHAVKIDRTDSNLRALESRVRNMRNISPPPFARNVPSGPIISGSFTPIMYPDKGSDLYKSTVDSTVTEETEEEEDEDCGANWYSERQSKTRLIVYIPDQGWQFATEVKLIFLEDKDAEEWSELSDYRGMEKVKEYVSELVNSGSPDYIDLEDVLNIP